MESSRRLQEQGNHCLYGEGWEEQVDQAIQNGEIEAGMLSWSQTLRWVVYSYRHNNTNSIVPTPLLQQIWSLLHTHVIEQQQQKFKQNSSNCGEEEEEDLMTLTTVGGVIDERDGFVQHWNRHQRFYILQDLRQCWDDHVSAAEQSLFRMIVPLVDQITARTTTTTKLPEFMRTTRATMDPPNSPSKDNGTATTALTKLCRDYWNDQSAALLHGNNENTKHVVQEQPPPPPPEASDDTVSSETNVHEIFETWVRRRFVPQQPQQQQKFRDFCVQMGKEGSRGRLYRELLLLPTTDNNDPTSSWTRRLQRSWNVLNDAATTTNGKEADSNESAELRRGKALIQNFLSYASNVKSPSTSQEKAATVLAFKSSDDHLSIQEQCQRYLNEEALPDLDSVTQVLWRENLEFCSKPGTLVSENSLEASTDAPNPSEPAGCELSDWIPFPCIMKRVEEFLLEIMSNRPGSSPKQRLSSAQNASNWIRQWIQDEQKWNDLFWEAINQSETVVETSLNLYHVYSSLLLWKGTGEPPVDCDLASVLASCGALVTVLLAFKPSSCSAARRSSKKCKFPLLMVASLFAKLECPPGKGRLWLTPMEHIQTTFQRLVGTTVAIAEDLSAGDFLRSAICFCVDNDNKSHGIDPSWSRSIAATAVHIWDCCRFSWIDQLLHFVKNQEEHFGFPLLLRQLYDEVSRAVWASSPSSLPAESLLRILMDRSDEYSRTLLEHVLCLSIPSLTCVERCDSSLPQLFESSLNYFQDSNQALPFVLLSTALRLDSVPSISTNGLCVRKNCTHIARAFFLQQLRLQNSKIIERLDHGWVRWQLSLYNSSLGQSWWKDVCQDLINRRDSGSVDKLSTIDLSVLLNSSLDSLKHQSVDGPSRKRSLTTTLFQPKRRKNLASQSFQALFFKPTDRANKSFVDTLNEDIDDDSSNSENPESETVDEILLL